MTGSDRHGLDEERLTGFMLDHVEGFAGPLKISQFAGGQSNPTYKLETPSGAYVLRRKPPGLLVKSAHAVDREYRVIKALGDTDFPVPKAFALCEDDDVLGTAFYIMEYVEGRVFWDFHMPDLSRAERGAVFESMCDNLAKLHQLDYKALGLEDFGRHGGFIGRQIGLWTKQFERSTTPVLPKIRKLIDWLPGAIPDDDSVSLMHGDYSIHNLLFHPSKPRLAVALDWELSTIGHPLVDLFYNGMAYYIPASASARERSFADLDCERHGIPTFDRYIEMYCERVGRGDIDNPSFYKAFILFRFAGIMQGVIERVKRGSANDPDADPELMTQNLISLADAAFDHARDAGAI